MLDLQQIARQIQDAGTSIAKRRQDAGNHAAHAAVVARWTDKDTELERRRLQMAETSWLAASPVSVPSDTFAAPPPPQAYSVVASDGSQIAPDRHEGAGSAYLLNVGRVRLTYCAPDAPQLRPRLDSVADVLTLDGDDEESERQAASGIGPRRFAREMRALSELASEADALGLPSVALTDGSLIAWHLRDLDDAPDDKPNTTNAVDPAQAEAFAALLELLENARVRRVPVAGYVSGPGSRDVVNTLRIGLCPLALVNCFRCPFEAGTLPCEPVRLSTDAALFGRLLCPGERSTVFSAEGQTTGYSHILKRYPPGQWIAFFYLHTGVEIARIEIPRWVADDPLLLDRVHAVCLDQSRKGRGYPVALAEAHEQAVVRGPDREMFLRLMEQAMVRQGVPVAPTPKAIAKRARCL